jgi:hypothetical protein
MTKLRRSRLGLMAWLVIASSVSCGGGRSTTPHTLSSGRTIKVITVGPMFATFGQALVLSYQTDLKLSDMDNLHKEVTEIWADFRKDVEKAKVDVGVITANEVPVGVIVTTNKSFNFVFERKPDTGWAPVSVKVDGATILHHGLFERKALLAQVAPDTMAGKTLMAREMPKWIAAPPHISRTRGAFFGYDFVVEGTPAGLPVDVTIVVEHPPFRQPDSAKSSDRESWSQMVTLGMPSFCGYSFDEDWEMKAGTWSVRVYQGARLLAEKNFDVK